MSSCVLLFAVLFGVAFCVLDNDQTCFQKRRRYRFTNNVVAGTRVIELSPSGVTALADCSDLRLFVDGTDDWVPFLFMTECGNIRAQYDFTGTSEDVDFWAYGTCIDTATGLPLPVPTDGTHGSYHVQNFTQYAMFDLDNCPGTWTSTALTFDQKFFRTANSYSENAGSITDISTHTHTDASPFFGASDLNYAGRNDFPDDAVALDTHTHEVPVSGVLKGEFIDLEILPPYYEAIWCAEATEIVFPDDSQDGHIWPLPFLENGDDLSEITGAAAELWSLDLANNAFLRGVQEGSHGAVGGSQNHYHTIGSVIPGAGALNHWTNLTFSALQGAPINHAHLYTGAVATWDTSLADTTSEMSVWQMLFGYKRTGTGTWPSTGGTRFSEYPFFFDNPPQLGFERDPRFDNYYWRMDSAGTGLVGLPPVEHSHSATLTLEAPPVSSLYRNAWSGTNADFADDGHVHAPFAWASDTFSVDFDAALPRVELVAYRPTDPYNDVSAIPMEFIKWQCGALWTGNAGVCSGRGACTAGGCVCSNTSAWGGPDCDDPKCYFKLSTDADVCNWRNGTCGAPDVCSCLAPADWTGSQCEIPICDTYLATDDRVCNYKNGTCIEPNVCKCTVPTDYEGTYCEIPICDGYPETDDRVCNYRNGTCIEPGVCKCTTPTDYDGTWCQTPLCFTLWETDDRVCNYRNGTCVSPHTCECHNYTEWEGNQCQLTFCGGIRSDQPEVCSYLNGSCVRYDSCDCEDEMAYYGDNCERPVCGLYRDTDREVCNYGNGTCVFHDWCECDPLDEWRGNLCDDPVCWTLTNAQGACNGTGTCIAPDTCECLPDFDGPDCKLYKCWGIPEDDPTVCHGNGSCVGVDTCACWTPGVYTGDECEVPTCDGIRADVGGACNDAGECVAYDHCMCDNELEWKGEFCEIVVCYGIDNLTAGICGSNGTCVAPDTCACWDDQSWGGDHCNQPVCLGLLDNDPLVCGQNGSCIGPDTCQCFNASNPFAFCVPLICNGTAESDPSACSTRVHGRCVGLDTCVCFGDPEPYEGDWCEYTVCNHTWHTDPSVCNWGNGTCDGPGFCDCTDRNAYTGDWCHIPVCNFIPNDDPTVCSGNGTCIEPDVCSCWGTHVGPWCSAECYGLPDFDGNVCHAHGDCKDNDWCDCWDYQEWGGYDCGDPRCNYIFTLDPSVCNSRGLCDNNTHVCTCESLFYSGLDCEIVNPVCLGIPSPDPTVCAGHGVCESDGVCVCDHKWGGNSTHEQMGTAPGETWIENFCGVPMCLEIDFVDGTPGDWVLANDVENVCSGKGVCTLNHTCLCEEGREGLYCEKNWATKLYKLWLQFTAAFVSAAAVIIIVVVIVTILIVVGCCASIRARKKRKAEQELEADQGLWGSDILLRFQHRMYDTAKGMTSSSDDDGDAMLLDDDSSG